jgi:hypothetical protein
VSYLTPAEEILTQLYGGVLRAPDGEFPTGVLVARMHEVPQCSQESQLPVHIVRARVSTQLRHVEWSFAARAAKLTNEDHPSSITFTG